MASMFSRTNSSSLALLRPRAVSSPVNRNGLLPASWSRGSISQLINSGDDLDITSNTTHLQASRSENKLSAGLISPTIKRKNEMGDTICRVPIKYNQQLNTRYVVHSAVTCHPKAAGPISSSSTTTSEEHHQQSLQQTKSIGACLVSSLSDSANLIANSRLKERKAKEGPLPRRIPFAYSKANRSVTQPTSQSLTSLEPSMSRSPQISFSSSLRAPATDAALEPQRRSPSPDNKSILRVVQASEDFYVLTAYLPGYSPDMVTVSSRRDDKLAVVADLWSAESDCHHEWLVTFPACDAQLSQARAHISADGTLTIRIPRRPSYWR